MRFRTVCHKCGGPVSIVTVRHDEIAPTHWFELAVYPCTECITRARKGGFVDAKTSANPDHEQERQ